MSNDNAMIQVDVRDAMSSEGSTAYTSLKPETMAEKAALYNVMSNPEHKVGDFINKKIMLKDVYVESIEVADEDTGELIVVPRIVLIDDKGKSYQAVSKGVFSSLSRLIKVFGEPTWEEPIPVVVRQINLKRGSMLSLEVDFS